MFLLNDVLLLTQIEKQEFGLKPMNCPGHCLMFQHRVRSYRGQLHLYVSLKISPNSVLEDDGTASYGSTLSLVFVYHCLICEQTLALRMCLFKL